MNESRLTPEERAQQKTLHQGVLNERSYGDRYRNLAYGFVRGFKYRRIERNHRLQELHGDWKHYSAFIQYREIDGVWCFEHNLPSAESLLSLLQKHLPEVTLEQVKAWLKDLTGAIEAPAPREKRVYPHAIAM